MRGEVRNPFSSCPCKAQKDKVSKRPRRLGIHLGVAPELNLALVILAKSRELARGSGGVFTPALVQVYFLFLLL